MCSRRGGQIEIDFVNFNLSQSSELRVQSSDVVQILLRTAAIPQSGSGGSAALESVAAGVAKRPGFARAGRACQSVLRSQTEPDAILWIAGRNPRLPFGQ